MQTFTDADGRLWKIALNIASVRDIREKMRGVETLAAVDFLDYAALLTSLNDVFFAADLLFVVVSKEAEAREIDAESFGRALGGSILFDAINAFVAAYIDFFPDPTIAPKLRTIVEKGREARTALAEIITAKTEAILEETLEGVATRLGERSSTRSGLPEETSQDSPT